MKPLTRPKTPARHPVLRTLYSLSINVFVCHYIISYYKVPVDNIIQGEIFTLVQHVVDVYNYGVSDQLYSFNYLWAFKVKRAAGVIYYV